MNEKVSAAYAKLCTEYYDLDKPNAPEDALSYYLQQAKEAQGPILEPMCGSGRFLIPIAKKGFSITGFDSSGHMLEVCRKRCQNEGLKARLTQASFEDFKPETSFRLVFIPSGSFCLLTQPQQVEQALQSILKSLEPKGKFVFEVETVHSVSGPQEVWKGNWIDKPDGSKLVLNTFSRFDPKTSVNTILCRYELWENNQITKTEVEDFRVRLYQLNELERTLQHHGFKILTKNVPYNSPMNDRAESILYECTKQ